MSASAVNDISNVEDKIQQRINAPTNALETIPRANHHQGRIPNTPAASSTIAFCLGGLFSFGLYTAFKDAFSGLFQIPYQLGLYLAAWAFFHWAEFTVTAAWNLEKCSIDCTSFSSQISRMLTRSSKHTFSKMVACTILLILQQSWSFWFLDILLHRSSRFPTSRRWESCWSSLDRYYVLWR
jgi:hypothetical protein